MKVLLFDFDGTLADSFELLLEIAHQITGIPPLDRSQMDRLRMMTLPKIFRELRLPVLKLPKLIVEGRQQMRDRITELRPFEGIPEALRALHEAGYELNIMTSNGPDGVRLFLDANHMGGMFANVYGNVGLFNKASAIQKMIKKRGLSKQNVYYIGDELRDVNAARRAGVRCVPVAWGFQTAGILRARNTFAFAETPADLPEIFKKAK